MTVGRIHTPHVADAVVRWQNHYGNAHSAESQSALGLVAGVNMVSMKRKRVLFSAARDLVTVAGKGVGGGTMFDGFFRTGPHAAIVVADVLAGPADSTVSTRVPRVRWTLNKTGEATFDQPDMHVGARRTGAVRPGELIRLRQRWTGLGGTTQLSADTEYYIQCVVFDDARVVSVCVYEEPVEGAVGSSTFGIRTASFLPGAPILDTRLDKMGDLSLSLWKKQASPLFNHGFAWHASPPVISSATYVNVLNTGLTDWTSNGDGWPVFVKRCGSKHSANVPCVWTAHIVGLTGSGTATLAMRTAAGVDIATVSSGTSTLFSTNVNLESGDNRIVQILGKTTGSSFTLFHLAMYQYES